MSSQSEYSAQDAAQFSVEQGSFADWSCSNQLEFDITFFERVVARDRCYVDAIRVLAELLTHHKSYQRGLVMDRRLSQLLPNDPLVRYNLACSYALVDAGDQALQTLRKAIELGYDDFEFMEHDPDLDSIRDEQGYQLLLQEHAPLRQRQGRRR